MKAWWFLRLFQSGVNREGGVGLETRGNALLGVIKGVWKRRVFL